MKKTDALVLPVVLTICLIFMVMVVSFFELSERLAPTVYSPFERISAESLTQSAIVYYCANPHHTDPSGVESEVYLFPNKSGMVIYSRQQWGLYEIIRCEIPRLKKLICFMAGSAVPPVDSLFSLWYRNNSATVTLAGNTNIEGPIAVPSKGVTYGRVQSGFYTGSEIKNELIWHSSYEMPLAGWDWDTVYGAPDIGIESAYIYLNRSEKPFSHIRASFIKIGSGAVLDNSLLFADTVAIEDGFKGTIQVHSKKGVSIGKGVCLAYPSGILSHGRIRLDENSEVNGYLISAGEENDCGIQVSSNCTVRGLLYSDGTSRLEEAMFHGSVIVNKTDLIQSNTSYSNILLDVTIYGSDLIGYPIVISGSPRRVVSDIDHEVL